MLSLRRGSGTAKELSRSAHLHLSAVLTPLSHAAGRLLKDVPAENLVWGNLFEKPIRDRLPWGTSAALKAVSYIDPSLKQDIYADKPWAFSPLIATMTRINVTHVPDAASAKNAEELFGLPSVPAFPHGATEPEGTYVHDDTSALLLKDGTNEIDPAVEDFADMSTVRELKDPNSGHKKRFTFWGSAAHREAVSFTPSDLATMVFDNGFLDFNTLRLELPYTGGMGFDLLNYWDGQPVRFYLRDERDEEVFLIVEFQITDKDA